MTDWKDDLDAAFVSGDPSVMKTMLARVPRIVLIRAVPLVEKLARYNVQQDRLEQAMACYDQLIEWAAGNIDWHADRARLHFRLEQLTEAMADAERITELAPDRSLGYRLQAEVHERLREPAPALAAYRQALHRESTDDGIKRRIEALEAQVRDAQILRRTLSPAPNGEAMDVELVPRPQLTFDPVLFENPSIPDSIGKSMIEGLKQHLQRYSAHQSCKNSLVRLEDPVWLAAWDTALSAASGSTMLIRGSELGLFALRALKYGVTYVLAVEQFAPDARITAGMVQKHFLRAWRAMHGARVQEWSDEERRRSFESFASSVDVATPDGGLLGAISCDYFIFPNIDHSLLGTGIVKAVRQNGRNNPTSNPRVLPARAAIFAMAIRWNYLSSSFDLRPMQRLRWSLYPQPLDLSPEHWTALTLPVRVGELDFQNFSEAIWQIQLPVVEGGTVDAIVYWFELDLGNTKISNAPGNDLRCIKAAVQYADSTQSVTAGQTLPICVHVTETCLHFRTQPAVSQIRSHGLPGWYFPMLFDQRRNEAYDAAIDRALRASEARMVLDIGAGCGLLSMMAAKAGAHRIVGCEMNPAISQVGRDTLLLNHCDDKVTIVNKPCQGTTVPDHLPERADLVIFELFDCSLIGEGVLHFLAYARKHLLTDDARFLPISAKIRAMVIEYRLNHVWDIDVNLLNPYRSSPTFVNVDAGQLTYRALTDPFDVFSFDFSTATPTPSANDLRISVISKGTAGAVLFWFDLQLDDTCMLSNDPRAEQSLHWKQGLQFMPEATIDASMQISLIAKHDGSGLTFEWKRDALPNEAFSTLPRFDPRRLAAMTKLEEQTEEMLQHCRRNADQYKQVAALATLFAIDPAAHDLDPIIAQRFAAMFFGV